MIEVKSADFRRAMTLASKVVEKRNTIPILGQVRVRANGALEVTGTDLDMMMTARVPLLAKSAEQSFMLPAPREVQAAVQYAGGGSVRIGRMNSRISVAAGEGELALKETCHAEDFPGDLDPVDDVFGATLSAEHLRLIARVMGAVSTEETRYYLNGVFLHHVDGWTYRAVATDGHRLYVAELALPDAKGDLPGIILPRRLMRVLLDKAFSGAGAVRLTVGYGRRANRDSDTAPEREGVSRVRFAIEDGDSDAAVAAKLIDGHFPDYKRVIPQQWDRTATFKVADLRRALRVVSVGSSRPRAVKLAFQDTGRARISAAMADLGIDAAVDIVGRHKGCVGFEIGFNGFYLLDLLDAITGDEASFAMGDGMAATIIRDPADTAWTAVLMPMRV